MNREIEAEATAEQTDAGRRVGDTVIPVFILALLIPLRGLHHLIPGFPDWPINTMAAIALAALGVFFPARWAVRLPLFAAAGVALWLELMLTSFLTQPDFAVRRAGSLTALLALAFVVGTGRMHLDSLRRGIAVALVIGVAEGVAAMPGATGYAGRLTGMLGDPNGVGFTVVTLGFIVGQRITNRKLLIVWWLFLGGSIWLTQSRTTIFAYMVATLWVLFGRRINRFVGILALAGVTWAFQWASAFMEAQGWFAERLGSDELRDRLAEVEQAMTSTAGWWGHGLGTAVAEFDGITLFFHNSYRALQTEGGLVALILLIIMGVALYWSFHSLPSDRRPVWAEAALIAACICSFNIGYSLTSVPMAMAVGMYLAYHCLAREQLQAEQLQAEQPVTGAAALPQ